MTPTPISPVLRKNILTLSKAYAKQRGIKQSTLSRLIRGDMYFLASLAKNEVGVTSWKYDEIFQWFTDHWPDDLPKPELENYIAKL